jgi:hypothetical protein
MSMSENDLRDEINRLVERHDRAAIDHLVLSLGGPDRDGLKYPSESAAVADLVPESGLPSACH